MPLRLNLLAEAQAAEEMRRRDPVKRALWAAALLISLVLVWSSSLQMKAMLAHSEVSKIESQITAHTNEYQQVLSDQKKIVDIKQKLLGLQQLATNRFLYGPLLNACQMTTVEDVQLVRLRTDQAYAVVESTKPRTNDDRVIPGVRGSATEKILLTLDGSDSSPNGDQYNRLKDAIATNAYFKRMLARTNGVSLKALGQPQISPSGKATVLFTLECRFPDRTR